MSVYRRGRSGVYWMRFCFEGRNIQRSTRLRNRREAENYEAEMRSRLVREGLGILERKSIPTLRQFSEKFAAEIAIQCAAKPRTVQFYSQQMKALLEYAPLADAKLNTIDAALLSAYTAYRSEQVSAASVNRALATLRRALRLAHEWKLLNRIPKIRLRKNAERSREYVLPREVEVKYLEAARQPLRDVALLILNTGLRLGEALALGWADLHMEPVNGSRYGYLTVREGKSAYARRSLPLTQAVREMLERRHSLQSVWVFPTPNDPNEAYRGTTLDHMHSVVRRGLGLPREFVLHSLRHTMLSRLGESGADAFTIQRVAGHHSVVMSQRYVHPSRGSIEASFSRFESVSQLTQSDATQPEPVTNLVAAQLLTSPPSETEGTEVADSTVVADPRGPVAQW